MSEMKWIPIIDHLPEGLGIFKVLDEDKGVDGIAAFNPKTKFWELFPSSNPLPQRITHWKRIKPQTNADRIRSMSDEELAKLLLDACRGSACGDQPQNEYGSVNCFKCRLDWLKQPVKEGEDE